MLEEKQVNLRHVKTFVKRIGRVTAKQQLAIDTLSSDYVIQYNANKKLNFTEIFGNDNEVVLEIGFGMGTSLLQMAKENPNKNYFGVEVHDAGVGSILHEIEENKVTNIIVMNYDAVAIFDNMLADNTLSGMQIYFPDPWHKTRHKKRRLVNPTNLELFARKMKKNAVFHFASDWLPYAKDALELLGNNANFSNMYDGYAPRPDWRPLTKFEKRGQDLDHKISDILFKRV